MSDRLVKGMHGIVGRRRREIPSDRRKEGSQGGGVGSTDTVGHMRIGWDSSDSSQDWSIGRIGETLGGEWSYQYHFRFRF